MKKTLIALALMLPMTSFASNASQAADKQAQSPFTPERNKAAGNLSTNIVILQKMVNGCKTPQTTEEVKATVNKWQQRNKAFLKMHNGYVTALIDSVKESAGEEEAKKYLANLSKVNNEQANDAIKIMVDKDGKEMACQKYFAYVEGGEMDVKAGKPDYKVLKEMLDFSTGKASKKK